MTREEVDVLIKTECSNKVRIHHLEGREKEFIAFLRYSIDDQSKMTI